MTWHFKNLTFNFDLHLILIPRKIFPFQTLETIPNSSGKDFFINTYMILMGSTSIVKLTEAGQSFLISSQSGKFGSASGANFNNICHR